MNTDSITTIQEEVETALEWAQDTGSAILRVAEHEFDAYLAAIHEALTPPAIGRTTYERRRSRCTQTGSLRYTFRIDEDSASEFLQFAMDPHELELTLEVDPYSH